MSLEHGKRWITEKQDYSGVGVVEWFRPGEYERVERMLEDLRGIGIRRLRTGISWADSFTPEGDAWYQWLMPRLAREVEILPCFLYTPPSLGLLPKTSAPPRDAKAYADFLDMFISRYGSLFHWVELWNEPNNLTEWDWTLDPHWQVFSEMIGGAAYWAKQRGKKTVLGGMSPIDSHWLCTMFKRGVMEYIDAVGIHGFPDIFDYNWKGWSTNIAMVQELLDQHGSNAEIWITEAGFSTWQHDEHEQVRQFLAAMEAPAVRMYWYGVDDLAQALPAIDRFHLDEREYHFGMKRSDGAPKLLHRLWHSGGIELLREIGSVVKSKSPEKGILITGGAGFVGSNLADHLLRQGKRVIIYDNLSRPEVEKNLRWLREHHGEKLSVVIASTLNRHKLCEVVAEASEIYHLAAQVAVTTSIDNPLHDFEANCQGTINLLEAVRMMESPPSVVFTSTNKVYGNQEIMGLRLEHQRHEPEDEALRLFGLSEECTLDFRSPYGCSKGSADQYVLDYSRTYNLPMAVMRMSCIYGPHQFGTEDQGWVAHFTSQVLQDKPITIYGDGKQVRDLLYVDDLVNALVLAHKNMPALQSGAFNIGGGPGNSISLLELLDILAELQGCLPQITFKDWRTGDQKYYVSDIRKFAAITGWKPECRVRIGVMKLYSWLKKHLNIESKVIMPIRSVDHHPATMEAR